MEDLIKELNNKEYTKLEKWEIRKTLLNECKKKLFDIYIEEETMDSFLFCALEAELNSDLEIIHSWKI